MTVVLSASSVTTYQDCHLKWWFTYVARQEAPESEPQSVGRQYHEAVEAILRAREVRGADAALYVGLYVDESLTPLLDVFTRDILPTFRNPLLIEEPFQIDVNGIPFSGVIDVLDEQDVPWGTANILRDHKTAASRPGGYARYSFAMNSYYMGVTHGLGFRVDGLQLDFVVRTKKPYYWPMVLPLPDEQDLAGWAAQIEIVAAYIADGDYEPTGLGTTACSWCNYRTECGPYQRFLEQTSPLRKEKSNG